MSGAGLPLPFLVAAMAFGAGTISLVGVNVVKLFAQLRETETARTLGKWAWGLSICALLLPYLAPISMAMGVMAYRRKAAAEGSQGNRRPVHMALLNSSWALVAFLGMIAIMLGTGMIGGRR